MGVRRDRRAIKRGASSHHERCSNGWTHGRHLRAGGARRAVSPHTPPSPSADKEIDFGMDPFRKKRQVNQVMLEGLRRSEKAIAFFCECDRDDCYQAAWLTCDEYERNVQLDGWRALSDILWEEPVRRGEARRTLDLASA